MLPMLIERFPYGFDKYRWREGFTENGKVLFGTSLWDHSLWSFYAIRLVRPRKGSWLIQ